MPHDEQGGRRWLIAFVLLTGVTILALAAFRDAGRWLVREDPLERADTIVILSGDIPYRAVEASRIYRLHYAPEIWITHSENNQEQLAALGVAYVGEEVYNREILLHEGVPPGSIRILAPPIVDTEEEIELVARELRAADKSGVIIVTSPAHTRRVRALWRELVGRQPRAMVRAAEEPYDAGRWWGNTRDSLQVSRELLGLLNVWAGLPVRPHDR
jgi:uncharacterized SAM-binding protein YcdF (DUF218 family)